MSNVMKCKMSRNVKCHEMPNVKKCQMSWNVKKCQMSRNFKCHEMSNVKKCQMSWTGPEGYPRVLDYSIFEFTTLPYSKKFTTRSSSRVVTISSFLSDHSNIQKIEMWNFQTLSWGLFSPVLIAAEAVQYSSTSFSPQAAPPPTAVPAALNTSWQFLLAPTGALYVVMHH